VLQLALQPNQTAQDCRQHQARDRDADDGGHLGLKQVVNVLHRWHEKLSLLDSTTGKVDANACVVHAINRRDYRGGSRCVQ
jgi:hypothetical protein